MPTLNANGASDVVTVELTPTQLAYIRREMFSELMQIAEALRDQAHAVAETDTIAGLDARATARTIIPDAVSVLDAIGWDVRGDAELLAASTRASVDGSAPDRAPNAVTEAGR